MCSRPAPSGPLLLSPWDTRALPCSPPGSRPLPAPLVLCAWSSVPHEACPLCPTRLQAPPCPHWSSVPHEACLVLHEHLGCRGGFLLGRRWPGLRLWAWNYPGVLTEGRSERRNQPLPAPAWLQEGRVALQPAFSHHPVDMSTCAEVLVCANVCVCKRVQTCVHVQTTAKT